MDNLNLCLVEGYLAANPVIRYVSGGIAVCNFSVAINKTRGKGDEAKKEVSFFDVTTWAKLAETCEKFLSKGSHVLVSGYLRQSRWQDKNGASRFSVNIEGREIKFLSPKTEKKAA